MMLQRYFFSIRLWTFLLLGSISGELGSEEGGDPGGLSREEKLGLGSRKKKVKLLYIEEKNLFPQMSKFLSSKILKTGSLTSEEVRGVETVRGRGAHSAPSAGPAPSRDSPI